MHRNRGYVRSTLVHSQRQAVEGSRERGFDKASIKVEYGDRLRQAVEGSRERGFDKATPEVESGGGVD